MDISYEKRCKQNTASTKYVRLTLLLTRNVAKGEFTCVVRGECDSDADACIVVSRTRSRTVHAVQLYERHSRQAYRAQTIQAKITSIFIATLSLKPIVALSRKRFQPLN